MHLRGAGHICGQPFRLGYTQLLLWAARWRGEWAVLEELSFEHHVRYRLGVSGADSLGVDLNERKVGRNGQ